MFKAILEPYRWFRIKRWFKKTRFGAFVIGGKCGNCGTFTRTYDAQDGRKWHVCVDCSSKQIGHDIMEHVMDPNGPGTCFNCYQPYGTP
jgi:hypothetical protein